MKVFFDLKKKNGFVIYIALRSEYVDPEDYCRSPWIFRILNNDLSLLFVQAHGGKVPDSIVSSSEDSSALLIKLKGNIDDKGIFLFWICLKKILENKNLKLLTPNSVISSY